MVGRMSTKRGKRKRKDSAVKTTKQQQQQQQEKQYDYLQHQQHRHYSEQASTRSSSTTNEPSPPRQQPQYEHQPSRIEVAPMASRIHTPRVSVEISDTNEPAMGHGNHSSQNLLADNIMAAINEDNFDEFLMFDHPGKDPILSTAHENPLLDVQPATTHHPQGSMALGDDYLYEHDNMLHLTANLPNAFSTSPGLLQQTFDSGLPTPTSSIARGYGNAGASICNSAPSNLAPDEHGNVVVGQPPQTPLSSLMKIINDLETGIRSDSHVRIDNRLIMNREAMAELRIVIGKDSFQNCGSCIVLVASALDLVLENYGCIVDAIKSEDKPDVAVAGEWDFAGLNTPAAAPYSDPNSQCRRTTMSGACSYASTMQLRIGCYELNQEDQRSLRNHVVRKELRRCIEIARICVNYSQGMGAKNFPNNSRVRASLQADTEASAYRLMAALECQELKE
jgi:hypothetical protein